MYRKARDFYMFILCPAILLYVFISLQHFLVESLEFFMYGIILSIGRDVFTSFSSSLFYLTILTQDSSILPGGGTG